MALAKGPLKIYGAKSRHYMILRVHHRLPQDAWL